MFKKVKKQTQEISQTFSKILREYTESLVLAVVFALIVRSFFLTAYRVPTEAMSPTIKAGDFIFSYQMAYGLKIPFSESKLFKRSPNRGDLAVFKCPLDQKISCIKRIVAVAGDRVELDEDGALRINGEKLKSKNENSEGSFEVKTEFLNNHSYKIKWDPLNEKKGFREITVPENHFFVLGDFRNQSEDSRDWKSIPNEFLIGKAFYIWFSLDWEEASVNEALKDIRWSRMFQWVR